MFEDGVKNPTLVLNSTRDGSEGCVVAAGHSSTSYFWWKRNQQPGKLFLIEVKLNSLQLLLYIASYFFCFLFLISFPQVLVRNCSSFAYTSASGVRSQEQLSSATIHTYFQEWNKVSLVRPQLN